MSVVLYRSSFQSLQSKRVDDALSKESKVLTYKGGEKRPPASSLGKKHANMYEEGGSTVHISVIGWKEGQDVTEADGCAIAVETNTRRKKGLTILSVSGKKGQGRILSGEKGKTEGFANPYACIALHRLVEKATRRHRSLTVSVDPDAPCSRLYDSQYEREETKRRYWNSLELIYVTVGFTLTRIRPDGYTPRLVSSLINRAELYRRLRNGIFYVKRGGDGKWSLANDYIDITLD